MVQQLRDQLTTSQGTANEEKERFVTLFLREKKGRVLGSDHGTKGPDCLETNITQIAEVCDWLTKPTELFATWGICHRDDVISNIDQSPGANGGEV